MGAPGQIYAPRLGPLGGALGVGNFFLPPKAPISYFFFQLPGCILHPRIHPRPWVVWVSARPPSPGVLKRSLGGRARGSATAKRQFGATLVNGHMAQFISTSLWRLHQNLKFPPTDVLCGNAERRRLFCFHVGRPRPRPRTPRRTNLLGVPANGFKPNFLYPLVPKRILAASSRVEAQLWPKN